MKPIKITVTGSNARVTEKPVITSGTVGLPVEFTFDEAWEGLSKTAVFRAGSRSYPVSCEQNAAAVPWEVLEKPGIGLYIGVFGTDTTGTVRIPTVWVLVDTVHQGTTVPDATPTEATPSVYDQILAAANEAEEVANSVREDADNGVFKGEKGEKGDKGDRGEAGITSFIVVAKLPEKPEMFRFNSDFSDVVEAESNKAAYTDLLDQFGNRLRVTNGAYSVNDGYLTVSGSVDEYRSLFYMKTSRDALDVSFKVRLPNMSTIIPGVARTGTALRTNNGSSASKLVVFYDKKMRIGGKDYPLTTDWTDITIRIDFDAKEATYIVGEEVGHFAFTGACDRLELATLQKGAFSLHIDDLYFNNSTEEPSQEIKNAIYLVPKADEDGSNRFDEYIYVKDKWEQIGSIGVEVNLDDYAKTAEVIALVGNIETALDSIIAIQNGLIGGVAE